MYLFFSCPCIYLVKQLTGGRVLTDVVHKFFCT